MVANLLVEVWSGKNVEEQGEKEGKETLEYTVCTELMLSVHRADCERASQSYSSGGGCTIFPGSRPADCYHTRPC